MFATFGEITFELLSSPQSFESTYRWTYAEQRVVEARPRLQWLSEDLRTIAIDLRFHALFTNPADQLETLIGAARDHNARALVFGNGDHQGYFVIAALRVTSTQMTAVGDVIAMIVRLDLKEWALDAEIDSTIASLPDFTPIAIVPAPPGAATGPVTYSGAAGVAATIAPISTSFTATLTAAPGVSPILADPATGNGSSAVIGPDDVPTSVIVRTQV
ncbi:MAG: phage tail protein [Candidatus Binataceae bacterium]|jgi:phage protein U